MLHVEFVRVSESKPVYGPVAVCGFDVVLTGTSCVPLMFLLTVTSKGVVRGLERGPGRGGDRKQGRTARERGAS